VQRPTSHFLPTKLLIFNPSAEFIRSQYGKKTNEAPMTFFRGYTKESGAVREYAPLVIPPNYSSKEVVLYDYSKLAYFAGITDRKVSLRGMKKGVKKNMVKAVVNSKRASIVGLQHTRRASIAAMNITKSKFNNPAVIASTQNAKLKMITQSKIMMQKSQNMSKVVAEAMAKANVRMGQAMGGATASTKGLLTVMQERVASISPKKNAIDKLVYNKQGAAEYV
jgi:hypothetical protein